MEKCVLIIDGNWLLQSRFSMLGKFFKKENPDITKQSGTNKLVDMMARSINVMLNRFPVVDNIILVSDGGSWRKNIKKPNSRKDIEYKGNRSQHEEFDWDYIWSALKILSDRFVEKNITYSNAKGIEGDDWIWYWSRYLNNKGINCIIWSSDNDLKQLVQNNEQTNSFTMWYNDKSGGFLHTDVNEVVDSESDILNFFFNRPIGYNQTLEQIKHILKSCVSYINPSNIILSKIMCGDSGDNIKPAASYIKKNRTYGLTQKMWNDISIQSKIRSIDDLLGHENEIAKDICNYKNFQKENVDVNDVFNNIIYNTQLVWLHESIIPTQYIKIMENSEYKSIDINSIRHNYKTLCGDDNEVVNMIDEIENLFD